MHQVPLHSAFIAIGSVFLFFFALIIFSSVRLKKRLHSLEKIKSNVDGTLNSITLNTLSGDFVSTISCVLFYIGAFFTLFFLIFFIKNRSIQPFTAMLASVIIPGIAGVLLSFRRTNIDFVGKYIAIDFPFCLRKSKKYLFTGISSIRLKHKYSGKGLTIYSCELMANEDWVEYFRASNDQIYATELSKTIATRASLKLHIDDSINLS